MLDMWLRIVSKLYILYIYIIYKYIRYYYKEKSTKALKTEITEITEIEIINQGSFGISRFSWFTVSFPQLYVFCSATLCFSAPQLYVFLLSKLWLVIINQLTIWKLLKIGPYHNPKFGGIKKKSYLCTVIRRKASTSPSHHQSEDIGANRKKDGNN